jgi:hypothetical protein
MRPATRKLVSVTALLRALSFFGCMCVSISHSLTSYSYVPFSTLSTLASIFLILTHPSPLSSLQLTLTHHMFRLSIQPSLSFDSTLYPYRPPCPLSML